jgi:thioredoxin 1
MESVLGEVADEMAGRAVVGKVHEQERALFAKFGVRGIPHIFVIKDGEAKEQFVGGRSKHELLKALKRYAPAA